VTDFAFAEIMKKFIVDNFLLYLTYIFKLENQMGVLIFVVIVLFLVGGLFILLRSANSHKLPTGIKSQPYFNDED
jgi:uncharacterized membrane protein YjdF